MMEYNPDVDDDYGRRRYEETGFLPRNPPDKTHVCKGTYQRAREGMYFVPNSNRDMVKRYRDWSRELTSVYSGRSERWLPKSFFEKEPYLVFYDYKHDIFAIYYGVRGDCYWIEKDRIDDKDALLGWIQHLSKKRWFSRKHLRDLLITWEDVFGINTNKGW